VVDRVAATMMRALSSLADSALLLPAAIVLLGYLLALGQIAAARIWVAVLVACGLLTLASKLLFHICGSELTEFDVVSPSGHASLATVFYGGLVILIGAGRPRWQRAVYATCVLVLLLLVGVSRVWTRAHTPEEVALGYVIGAFCVGLFAVLHARAGRPSISPVPLAVGFVVVLALLGGSHFSLEPVIGGVARRASAYFDVCAAETGRPARSQRRYGGLPL
jgi:membrane-associated phospholipid phosphatase